MSTDDKLVEVSDLKEALIIGLAALGYLNPEQTDKHWNTLERKLREIEKRAENSVQSAIRPNVQAVKLAQDYIALKRTLVSGEEVMAVMREIVRLAGNEYVVSQDKENKS